MNQFSNRRGVLLFSGVVLYRIFGKVKMKIIEGKTTTKGESV